MMKKVMKIVGVVGCFVAGLVLALVVVQLLQGKAVDIDVVEMLGVLALAIVSAVVAFFLQVIVHEAGHLVAGLLTGYRFVSFRIFSLALIRHQGKLLWRRFTIGGTAGQCLMAPPARPLDAIDTRWYNLGGVLANVLVATIATVVLLCCDAPAWICPLLALLAVIGFFFALLNGIPLRLSGISNDGYNMVHLERSPGNKRLLCQLLEANALLQEGVRPRDVPATMFDDNTPVDWSDDIQANWQLMVVSRLEDQRRWEDAYQLLSEAVTAKGILPIIDNELRLEMIFVCLVTGRVDEARALYTDRLKQYLHQYMPTQSGKQRVQYAITLLLDHDPAAAHTLLATLRTHRGDYILQGETTMDLELMEELRELSVER